jgi:hypothetical protein
MQKISKDILNKSHSLACKKFLRQLILGIKGTIYNPITRTHDQNHKSN